MPCSEMSKPLSSSWRDTLIPMVCLRARNIIELMATLAAPTAATPMSCGTNAWSGENTPTASVPQTRPYKVHRKRADGVVDLYPVKEVHREHDRHAGYRSDYARGGNRYAVRSGGDAHEPRKAPVENHREVGLLLANHEVSIAAMIRKRPKAR